jgi:hypothetical protein
LQQYRKISLRIASALFAACIAAAGMTILASANNSEALLLQVTYPQPPADHALVYVADAQNALMPLPFETGTTALHLDAVAKSDKRSYVEIRGERATTLITNDLPHFYLFVPDEANVKLPFIVRLSEKNGARRVTAMAQKGYKGFAVDSEEIIKPNYRVLSRNGGVQFMEVSPREPLMTGEYAIMGADLGRIATFRIAEALSR